MLSLSAHARIDKKLILYATATQVVSELLKVNEFDVELLKIKVGTANSLKILHPDQYACIYLKTSVLNLEKNLLDSLKNRGIIITSLPIKIGSR